MLHELTIKSSLNSAYQYCAADARTSDLVPIIVGACLGGLVIIVLVAYLIGRVRAKRQGYNSV
uniref:MHC class II antigen n=1 Tax=Meloidogyne hapla TaxID=6305 RepID=A0A1I8BDY5_MELHA